MHLFEQMINDKGIICFNLIGKSKIYYDQVKKIIGENFYVLKDEKNYCNGYFILTKNLDIFKNAEKNQQKTLFNSVINIDVKGFIKNFISKNNEIIAPKK